MTEQKKLLVIVSETSGAQEDVRPMIESVLEKHGVGFVYKSAKNLAM